MDSLRHLYSGHKHDSGSPYLRNREIETASSQCIDTLEKDSRMVTPFHDLAFVDELNSPLAECDMFMDQASTVPLDWSGNGPFDGVLESLSHSNNSLFPDGQDALWHLSSFENEHTSPSELAGISPPIIPQGPLTPKKVQPTQQDLYDSTPRETCSGTVEHQRIPTSARPVNIQPSLPRRRSRYLVQRYENQVTSKPLPNQVDSCDPLQRWRNSPPEDEPASMSAIVDALHNSQNLGHGISNDKDSHIQGQDSFRGYRRPTSLASSNSGSSASSWQSGTSKRSATSQNPLTAQTQLGFSRVNKGRRGKKNSGDAEKRIFCCTFCCDTFKSKYDWVRHEKSLHLNLEGWVCAPHGVAPISSLTGRRHCAYCHCLEPSAEHLEQHSSKMCSEGRRTFRRKDHLVQHLRQYHRLEILPLIDDWKETSPTVTSRCGFCDYRLDSWNERIEHLAAHFRQGSKMDEWQGVHDFPPSIAAKITNALPVYLIGSESKTMVPFSATNSTVKDHFAQISGRAGPVIDTASEPLNEVALASSFQQLGAHDAPPLRTFTEILTLHLARYSRQQMSLGICPTDEMFQQESRRLLYDSEDPWNQTIADNPEWISAFKQQCVGQSDIAEPAGQDNPTDDATALP